MVGIQEEILRLHSLGLLDGLLADRTTGGKILWATDAYEKLGPAYARDAEITVDLITGENSSVVKTRARKELEQQAARTRRSAEVFTPMKICKKMNDEFDENWFGTFDAFKAARGRGRKSVQKAKETKKTWRGYVDTQILEITCGEAPFLVSRYDVTSVKGIPLRKRIGLLDRKLRLVNEHTRKEHTWMAAAVRAFRATYGYELQGDSLLIARVNLLNTFEDYLQERWGRTPTDDEYEKIVDVIVWNVWQMDGLTCTNTGEKGKEDTQMSLFAADEPEDEKTKFCKIKDWRKRGKSAIHEFRERESEKMKFDFIIGNPPYQEETKDTSDKPIYNDFMDTSFSISDKVELITPARFLFNAGKTPKAWNEKMLADPHFKVLLYEQDSSKFFTNNNIMGGLVITYRDADKDFGAIGTFTHFNELNQIMNKVLGHKDFTSLSDFIYSPESYKFTPQIHSDNPWVKERLSQGHMFDITTNIFDKIPELFTEEKTSDEFIGFYGLAGKKRAMRWIKRDYVQEHENLNFYKVILPKSNGSPAIGESEPTPVIGQPVIAKPLTGHTQTFLSIGKFRTEEEADAALKYVKSKFARTMLGILKATQHNPPSKWQYVPMQNFTPSSDIDWTKSVSEIDRQLYKKYDLDEKEIAFIESHVKEME